MPAFLEQDETEIVEDTAERVTHSLHRVGIVVAVDGDDGTADLATSARKSPLARYAAASFQTRS